MKNLLLVMIALTSFPLRALTPWELAQEAQKLQDQAPGLDCSSGKQEVGELYTPAQAIADINAGKLTFLGRDLFPGSDQNRTCVYKSDRAYILYNNCMASKKESPALDIEVISFDGNITSFYILNKDAKTPVSAMDRSQYDMSWRISVTPSPAVGKMNIAQLKAYKEKYSPDSGGCFIGNTFGAQEMSSEARCFSGLEAPQWKKAAEAFWKKPSDDWYATQKYLRKVIAETKF